MQSIWKIFRLFSHLWRLGRGDLFKSHGNSADNTPMVSPVQSQLINAQLAPVALGSQISASVAAKVLASEKQQGDAVVSLINAATGTAIPAPDSPGQALDVTA